MTTREKIILALSLLTVLFGVYEVFLADSDSSPSKQKGETASEIAQFIQQVSVQIKQTEPSQTEKYIITHSQFPWKKNPFIDSLTILAGKSSQRTQNRKDENSPPRWKYSGFISLGSKKIAIINGIEYEVGESLLSTGYYLKKIYQDHIELARLKDGKMLILPFIDNQP